MPASFKLDAYTRKKLKGSVLKAAPFEEGNGRIARPLSEMLLTRSDETSQRFYA